MKILILLRIKINLANQMRIIYIRTNINKAIDLQKAKIIAKTNGKQHVIIKINLKVMRCSHLKINSIKKVFEMSS